MLFAEDVVRRGMEEATSAAGFGKLPGVSVAAGRLTIAFGSPEQLYERLVSIAVYFGEHPEAPEALL